MKNNLREQIIELLQGDLPVLEQPFAAAAEKIGVSEEELLDEIRKMRDEGLIRRVGAVVRHQQAGFRANAMVAFQLPETEAERVGQLLAQSSAVTHCYWRESREEWPYNLYCMVHAVDHPRLDRAVRQLVGIAGCSDYQVLGSIREFKKSSVRFR